MPSRNPSKSSTRLVKTRSAPRKVFIVHGHDEAPKEKVARFLERVKFLPIILHEQVSGGRTIIEKIEAHTDVQFAVVLLTPDDMGSAKDSTPNPRARQNVVLELGYFMAKLGRDRVCALKRDNVEIPSDIAGVVYQTFDAGDAWKHALGKELEGAGFDIDWNLVMRQ
jgi:predicted nucleotide-binding protein